MGLQAKFNLTGGFLHTSGALSATGRMGTSPMPIGLTTFADGTGAGQANQVFLASFSINATTMQLYDLKGGNGELDVLNAALAMTAVKLVIVEITTPAASTSIRFGPQNQTNAAQLWFQAATANFYDTVSDALFQKDARAGWALDSTHKVLGLYNPGAAAVAGTLLVVGTK
jgi:hypothetical protein